MWHDAPQRAGNGPPRGGCRRHDPSPAAPPGPLPLFLAAALAGFAAGFLLGRRVGRRAGLAPLAALIPIIAALALAVAAT